MYDRTRKDIIQMIELLEHDGSRWSQLFQKALFAFDNGEYLRCAETILSGSRGMGVSMIWFLVKRQIKMASFNGSQIAKKSTISIRSCWLRGMCFLKVCDVQLTSKDTGRLRVAALVQKD